MAIKLFELVKEEAGAIVPKYEFGTFKEFKEIIEKPVINFIGYEKRVLGKNIADFVEEKTLEYFNYLLEEHKKPVYSSEYFIELNSMKENFEKNVKKASVSFACPKEASMLISEIRNLSSSKYVLLNIDKINDDLIRIYYEQDDR